MRWPPNSAWTSASKRSGYRHFEVNQYGGRNEDRWVQLRSVNNREILIRVLWSEIKTDKWKSGWLQLPKEEDSNDAF